MTGPTIGEIGQTILQGTNGHKLVHVRLGYVDCDSTVLLEAWEQIRRTITLLETKVVAPEDHRAEALLLMILQEACFHGYTPAPDSQVLIRT